MRRGAAEVKGELLFSLGSVLDKPLGQFDFVRGKNSLVYARTLGDVEQQIVFAIDYFPTYEPHAEAHIHPMLKLTMKKLGEFALVARFNQFEMIW
jgi:hypothetical protein